MPSSGERQAAASITFEQKGPSPMEAARFLRLLLEGVHNPGVITQLHGAGHTIGAAAVVEDRFPTPQAFQTSRSIDPCLERIGWRRQLIAMIVISIARCKRCDVPQGAAIKSLEA
jgi:hypothetical protein